MQTTIVYISGLGDRYDGFRAFALRFWRLWGVTAAHVPIKWYDGQAMESKMSRIHSAIDTVPSGGRIVLVGESAGATLALHTAHGDTRVDQVITLCGVTRANTPVSDRLRRRAPALDQAVRTLPGKFDVEIHSVRAVVDGVVGSRYSIAPGAVRHVVWSIGHLTTIALCLTIYAPIMANIAKKYKK